ncbi:cell wall-active antibiotics response protein LiaF [Pseudoneobacillus sp. C159]
MRQSLNQIIFAGGLLFVGIFLLLLNIGVISLEIKEVIVESYPFLFLFISSLFVIRAIKRHKKGSLFWWFFLTALFLMLSLDRLRLISFHISDFWKLWPVLFIYFGLNMLFGKSKVKIYFHPEIPPEAYKNENEENLDEHSLLIYRPKKIKKSFSIGDVEYKKANWALEPMNLYNSIGDYFIDFSKAYIPEKETPIIVSGWIGDVKMIVPEGIPVKVEAKVKVGDIRVFELRSNEMNRHLTYTTPGYDEAVKKLTITIALKVGSVRIDKV